MKNRSLIAICAVLSSILMAPYASATTVSASGTTGVIYNVQVLTGKNYLQQSVVNNRLAPSLGRLDNCVHRLGYTTAHGSMRIFISSQGTMTDVQYVGNDPANLATCFKNQFKSMKKWPVTGPAGSESSFLFTYSYPKS